MPRPVRPGSWRRLRQASRSTPRTGGTPPVPVPGRPPVPGSAGTDARHTGQAAASRVTASAAGTAASARPVLTGAASDRAAASAASAPTRPAPVPTTAISPSSSRSSWPRVQPRQLRVASSIRGERAAAPAALAVNTPQTTSTRVNSSMLLRSTARSTVSTTPLRCHRSDSSSAGRPAAPAGSAMCCTTGALPTVTSTSRPVAPAIASAASRTRSRLTASVPRTPATRTFTALIGAVPPTPSKTSGSVNTLAASSEVNMVGGGSR